MSHNFLDLIAAVDPLTHLLSQYTNLPDAKSHRPPQPITLNPQLPDNHPLHQLCQHFQLGPS